ncbi:MAG TPA: ATP-binding protein [Gemmatimonadaceae bacterium]
MPMEAALGERPTLTALDELVDLRQRLRVALQEVTPTLLWFARQQTAGGMPANIWKNLDRLPSPRMWGLAPAFDLVHALQRQERTLRQFDADLAGDVRLCLTELVDSLSRSINEDRPRPGATVDPGLVRLLTDDRTGTLSMDSAARILRCGCFPIRIAALPTYAAGHVIFSELRRTRIEFETTGVAGGTGRVPGAAFVAQGVAAVRAFLSMVRTRADACASIAGDLSEIRDLRRLAVEHLAANHEVEITYAQALRQAQRAQEHIHFSRLAANFREMGVSTLGLRSVFQSAALKANEAAAAPDEKELAWLFQHLSDAKAETKAEHTDGQERAREFVRSCRELLTGVLEAVASLDAPDVKLEPGEALKKVKALEAFHRGGREAEAGGGDNWSPSIAHSVRAKLLKDILRERVAGLPPGTHAGTEVMLSWTSTQAGDETALKRLSSQLKAAWKAQLDSFVDDGEEWIALRTEVFGVAEQLAEKLLASSHTSETGTDTLTDGSISAFDQASTAYRELERKIRDKLDGVTRWLPSFAERLLLGCLIEAPDRHDPLDLLAALWLCDRMGHGWTEDLEDRAAIALGRLQRRDGSFEAGRPPIKWVHGFVMAAPSAASLEVLAGYLASRAHTDKRPDVRADMHQRRWQRWCSICLKATRYLLDSRVGEHRTEAEFTGWHSDRQPEDGRIDLATTCIALRALAHMDELLSKAINFHAFEGLLVTHPVRKKPADLFAFDAKSTDPSQSQIPVVVSALQASEWMRYHARSFALPDPLPPPTYKPRTTLYYGPPGTGKTYVSQIIAGELGWPLVTVNPYHFLREGEHFVGKVAAQIFRQLEFASNCCVIFDEFDQLVVDRNVQAIPSGFAMVTTTMLPLLADLHERAGRNNCLIAFATNYRGLLDAAAIRHGRIDLQSCVVYPDFGSRCLLMLLKAGNRERDAVDVQQAARASAMRAVSDVIKVASTQPPVPPQSYSPALGPGHYLDMLRKIRDLRRGADDAGQAPLDDAAEEPWREIDRFLDSLDLKVPNSQEDFMKLDLTQLEASRWSRLIQDRRQ